MSNLIKERSEQTLALKEELGKLDLTTKTACERAEKIAAQISENDAVIAAESRRQEILSKPVSPDLTRGSGPLGERGFDFAKVLRYLNARARGAPSTLDGLEAELIQEGEKEARAAGYASTGIVLPNMLVRRYRTAAPEYRDLTATGPQTEGGLTIATEKRGLLDDFFETSIMHQAGATILDGLTSNIDLPRIVSGNTLPSGKTENENADLIEPSFDMLSLRPKRLAAYLDISEQLLNQSSSVVEQVLRRYLTDQLGVVSERAFFHGTGNKEATGILKTPGIGSVEGGTNGAAVSLKTLVNLETAVDTQNALQGSLHYVTNGAVRGALKQAPIIGSSDSRRLLESNAGDLNGYTPLFSNAISRTLTKGNSAQKCSALIFGNFADYVCSYWSGLSLELVRDKHNAQHGLYTLVASLYYDGGVVRPKSFAACTDVLTA